MWQQRKHFSADDGNFKAKNIFSLRQLFIIWQFSIAPVRCVFGPAVKNSSRSISRLCRSLAVRRLM
jgi:hypothetical protein